MKLELFCFRIDALVSTSAGKVENMKALRWTARCLKKRLLCKSWVNLAVHMISYRSIWQCI